MFNHTSSYCRVMPNRILTAIMSMMLSVFLLQQSHAGDTAVQDVASSVQVSATNIDPIVTFVQADYDKKADMLKSWPADQASFDKLMGLLDAETLMVDADNNVYEIKNDSDLINYQTGQNMGENWPSSIDTVSLNTNLRAILETGSALTDLTSTDEDKRTAAIDKLSENPEAVELSALQTQVAAEKNASLKEKLEMLIARKQLAGTDAAAQLAAASTLAGSNNPETLALINKTLEDSSISAELKAALESAKSKVDSRISRLEWTSHLFSGLSMASILLLAALGLAITYGLLGVINMAHGELIMIGAYATYVVQGLFSKYMPELGGFYLLAAIPVAFIVSALVGILIERIVVKPLYGRELETLLATFGVSLILIQVTRMIFGAQNVAVESVGWLSGGIHLSSSVILPYNRIAIIVFTLLVLLGIKFLISYTRFGLFVRAVTQNRGMARAVGVPSTRIDMMAFGLGSGIAGLAGCALAQIGNVGPDLGQSLIVDTFLVVVVGGVGQLAGAALASLGLGVGGTFLEVGIGAVLAKIALLVMVILFIQKRPQGLFSVKGRFVDD